MSYSCEDLYCTWKLFALFKSGHSCRPVFPEEDIEKTFPEKFLACRFMVVYTKTTLSALESFLHYNGNSHIRTAGVGHEIRFPHTSKTLPNRGLGRAAHPMVKAVA